jgi:glycosyltransferase involved in cell wall biosynthesis
MNDVPVRGHGEDQINAPMAKAIEDAQHVLEGLGQGNAPLDPAAAYAIATARRALASLATQREAEANAETEPYTDVEFAFDVSDLLAYFPFNRAPTGIQRVQMEVINAFIDTPSGAGMRLCRFLKEADRWVEVPLEQFLTLCAASKTGSDAQAKDWLDAYNRLDAASRSRESATFRPGSVLVNLGSSWWLPNYFMQVRHLKSTMNVRYVPLIYDMIPAMAPQFCIPELVAEFITWLSGVLEHADYFLAISEATKKDLIELAARIGHEVPPDLVGVVPLDADYRSVTSEVAAAADAASPISRKYVLLVSTLEVRKNQLAALDAWRTLINQDGLDGTPQLVLVGKKGYLGNRIEERLQQDETLRKRVTVLSHVDDVQLAELYKHCLFTIYPSAYEGWGLPVTESLCYGKVPLIADGSSLPEAGGRFAVYFATGSGSDFLAKVRRLIADASYRQELERTIVSGFRARQWSDVAGQIEELLTRWTDSFADHVWQPPVAHPGYYYGFGRGSSRAIWKGMGSAEYFRQGVSWWELEPWGCWSKAAGGGLQMRIDGDVPVRLALQLRGQPRSDTDIEIRSANGAVLVTSNIPQTQEKWIFVDFDRNAVIDIRLVTNEVGGADQDHRRLGIGLMAFFVIDATDPDSRMKFIEGAALGSLHDLSYFRRQLS